MEEKKDAVKRLERHKRSMREGTVNRLVIEDIRTETGEYPSVEAYGDTDGMVLVNRLLEIEESLAKQYVKMKRDLPERAGWEATPLKNLILAQQRCVGLLTSFQKKDDIHDASS